MANSVYVIRLWHHHHPVSSVYSNSDYITVATSYVACMLAYFLHKCILSKFGMWHILAFRGIFIVGTYSAVVCQINVAVYCFMMDLCINVVSVCRLQQKCSGHKYALWKAYWFLAYFSNVKCRYTRALGHIVDCSLCEVHILIWLTDICT